MSSLTLIRKHRSRCGTLLEIVKSIVLLDRKLDLDLLYDLLGGDKTLLVEILSDEIRICRRYLVIFYNLSLKFFIVYFVVYC